ncbi:hypothetical protein KIPB_016415, partial [Kipferlia bialata]
CAAQLRVPPPSGTLYAQADAVSDILRGICRGRERRYHQRFFPLIATAFRLAAHITPDPVALCTFIETLGSMPEPALPRAYRSSGVSAPPMYQTAVLCLACLFGSDAIKGYQGPIPTDAMEATLLALSLCDSAREAVMIHLYVNALDTQRIFKGGHDTVLKGISYLNMLDTCTAEDVAGLVPPMVEFMI